MWNKKLLHSSEMNSDRSDKDKIVEFIFGTIVWNYLSLCEKGSSYDTENVASRKAMVTSGEETALAADGSCKIKEI